MTISTRAAALAAGLGAIMLATPVVTGPATAGATATTTATGAATKPNIVLFLADDLDATATPYWDAMPKTKALLADTGHVFTNAFAPTPICCPARSTILTGKYGHNTGVLTNGGDEGGWQSFHANGNEEHTSAVALQAAGYHTALVGKYLNGIETAPDHIPPGWSDWYASVDNNFYFGYGYQLNENGVITSYGTAPEDYSTDVVARTTVGIIDAAEADDDQPLFLYVAPTAPHLPLPPPPRYQDNPWAHASVPRTPNYGEPDLSDKARWLQSSGDTRSALLPYTDVDYRNRMGSLMALDDLVADTYAALERDGELDNTVFVFASDNGYNNGSHRLLHKMAPYEESIRIPMLVAGPGIVPGTDDRFVLQTDWFPTMLDLAGVPVPGDVDGQSLVPLLTGGPVPSWRTDFLTQYKSNGAANGAGAELPPWFASWLNIEVFAQDVPSYRSLRTERYAYVEWYGNGTDPSPHEYELYDLQRDPFQLHNLLATPWGWWRNVSTVVPLQQRMTALLECQGESCRA